MHQVTTTEPEAGLSVREAAKLANVSRQTIKRWLNSEKLRGWRTPGGYWRTTRGDLIAAGAIQPSPTEYQISIDGETINASAPTADLTIGQIRDGLVDAINRPIPPGAQVSELDR